MSPQNPLLFEPFFAESFFEETTHANKTSPHRLLHAKKSDEYFIAISQQDWHTFIMLGVMLNGKPTLLTRIGKASRKNPNLCSFFFSELAAQLSDEGITRRTTIETPISYSAYTITYQQVLDFIGLVEKINQKTAIDREKEDLGCCSLLMTETPKRDMSNIPLEKFESAYIRVVNKNAAVNELYYVDKRDDTMTKLDSGRHIRVIYSRPSAFEKKRAIAGNEVLLYFTFGTYKIGFRNEQGKYQVNEIKDTTLIKTLSQLKTQKVKSQNKQPAIWVENISVIDQINDLLASFHSPTRIHRNAQERLNAYDACINSTLSPSKLSKKQLKTITSLTGHTHLSDKKWYEINKAIDCFKPIDTAASDTDDVTFIYTTNKVSKQPVCREYGDLYQNLQVLNRKKNCRGSAIEILNYTRESTETPHNISSFFGRALPIQTTLKAGAPTDQRPFYILPLPPTAFKKQQKNPASEKKLEFLTKLYRRMEEIITLESDSPLTKSKFDKLKALYKKVAGKSYAQPDDLLKSIQQWREKNPDIGQLRKTYFFDDLLNLIGIHRESATTKFFNEFRPQIR